MSALKRETEQKKAIQQLLEDTKSNVMAMAVQQLMNSGNDAQINRAIAIFDEHKGEMDPAQRAKLEPHVIQMQQLVAGEAKANEIWEKVGPKGLNDPINFVEMEKVLKGIPDRNEREFAERELIFNSLRSSATLRPPRLGTARGL